METLGPFKGIILGFCWGYKGIMEKKMETTIERLGFRVYGGLGLLLALLPCPSNSDPHPPNIKCSQICSQYELHSKLLHGGVV